MVQFADLEYGSVKLPSERMGGLKKKAVSAILIAVACVAVLVVVVTSTTRDAPDAPVGLEQRGALRASAERAQLAALEHTRARSQASFDALQSKIEADLGMPDASRLASTIKTGLIATRRSTRGATIPFDGPAVDTADNAKASATLSAARAQDALHHIQDMERDAQRAHEQVYGHANDAYEAKNEIDRELGEVADATRTAQDALRRATRIQAAANDVLSNADAIRENAEQKAAHIDAIEQRVEQQAAQMENIISEARAGGNDVYGLGRSARFAHNAVNAIHAYLQEAFSMASSMHNAGNYVNAKLSDDMNRADKAVNALEHEAAYGANAADVSQHYANAARLFALHAAGAANAAVDAVDNAVRAEQVSMQAAFHALQAAKGAKYAQQVAAAASAGANAAQRVANGAVSSVISGPDAASLPPTSDPVARAKALIDRMVPVLSKAADDLEAHMGDCAQLRVIVGEMRTDMTPLNEAGDSVEMTHDQLEEVQAYVPFPFRVVQPPSLAALPSAPPLPRCRLANRNPLRGESEPSACRPLGHRGGRASAGRSHELQQAH